MSMKSVIRQAIIEHMESLDLDDVLDELQGATDDSEIADSIELDIMLDKIDTKLSEHIIEFKPAPSVVDMDLAESESEAKQQAQRGELAAARARMHRTAVGQKNFSLAALTCPKCYRIFGHWMSQTGAALDETAVQKNGVRIILVDDL